MVTDKPPFQLLLASALLAGCASGPVSLAGAKVSDVRVFAFTGKPGAPTDSVDLTKLDQVPCDATEINLAVEVRAVLAGADREELYASGGGLKERIKASPAEYQGVDVGSAYDYEQSHMFDMRSLDFQVSPGVTVERQGNTNSGGMYSSGSDQLALEQVKFRLDHKKAALTGFEITTFVKDAPDRKATRSWKPNPSCNQKTLSIGGAGDLEHTSGDPGPTMTVYVTRANGPAGETALAMVEDKEGTRFVLLPIGGPHVFVSQGGNGVDESSARPGGNGGAGGIVQILVDDRHPELQTGLSWEAPGGRGGRGGPDGQPGPAGQGGIKLADVKKVFGKRIADLPKGVTLVDPVEAPEPPKPPKGPPTKPPKADPPKPKK